MASSVKNAARSSAAMPSPHAAQNLRTTSSGLSIRLLLRSGPGSSGRVEYQLLVDLAALQQSMGLGGLGHGQPALVAESKGTGSQQRHGLIDRFGGTVRCGRRQRNAQAGSVLIGES